MASLKFLTELDCKLLQFLIFLSCVPVSVSAVPSYIYATCSNDANFTANSSYAVNLDSVLAFLSSTIAPYDKGFYSGALDYAVNGVYGLFLCRGDLDTETCKDCVTSAVQEIKLRCPGKKRAVIYYEECLIRYSDDPIFSRLDSAVLYNTQNISSTQLNLFEDTLVRLMNNIITEAANSQRRFAVKKDNFSVFSSVYGLGQCTQDLSIINCENCLRQTLIQLAVDKIGARVMAASCNVRYENYPFFNESFITVTTPPPSVLVSPPSPNKENGKRSTKLIIAIVAPISVLLVIFVSGYCFIMRRAKKKYNTDLEDHDGDEITNMESLQYDFATIESATNKFSDINMLGKGGFGQVYKGTLPNGQEIAVKRLSKSSGQGAQEFKNEVVLVAKLQHRNLVTVLGFCLEENEKILVYECVPNKSLDYFLFDAKKREELDWSRRYKIIGGVARGLEALEG